MKKIIGIVPASSVGDPGESCMKDYYRLGNNYIKRVTEAGCIPLGLAPVDNLLSEEIIAKEWLIAFLSDYGFKIAKKSQKHQELLNEYFS